METMTLNSKEYRVIRLLGKGGYSYLVTDGAGKYVLKQIHHEHWGSQYWRKSEAFKAHFGL